MIYPTGTITIEELQSVKLPVVNFAEGYKVAEVDVFLGKCADTLRNGYGLSAEEVDNVRIPAHFRFCSSLRC